MSAPTMICPACQKGKLRLVYHIPCNHTVSYVTYRSSLAVFRCTNKPACGKTTRRVGTASFQLRIAETIVQEARVWTREEAQIVTNSAYLMAETQQSIGDWLRQKLISPQAIEQGSIGTFIQGKLRDVFLTTRTRVFSQNPAAFAPYATLESHKPHYRRLQRSFMAARA